MSEVNLWSIYIHTNTINNKVYIGKAKGKVNRRWGKDGKGYLHKNKEGKYSQPLFANAIIKYGWNNFKHEIIKTKLTEQEANVLEISLIEQYNSDNPDYGYNITKGGDGITGYRHTDEAKLKISKYQKQQVHDKTWNENVSKSKMGHFVSEDTRKKISISLKGKKSGDKHPMYKKHLSEETKELISKKHIGLNKGIKNHKSKPVVCVETNMFYESAHMAGEAVNINYKLISDVLHGRQKSTHGYHWRYATAEEIELYNIKE